MLTNSLHIPLLAPRDFSSDTRARLDRLTEELSTGRKVDTGRALRSDFSAFSQVSHELRTLDARQIALTRAGQWLEATQTSISTIKDIGQGFGNGLNATFMSPGAGQIAQLAGTADSALEDMVAVLAKTDGGRSIFSNGDNSGQAPYNIDLLKSETRSLAQNATSISSLLQAFDDYFALGGAVEAGALASYPADPVRFPLGQGASIDIPIAAGDTAIRDALKQAAIVASLGEVGFTIDLTDRLALAVELPARSLQAANGLVQTQGKLGAVEERASKLSQGLDASRSRLEMRRSDAVATDPFEVASRIQTEMTRLETIYAVTARRSSLRLTDYMR